MKATFNNSYPKMSKNGKMIDVFVYHVSGTEAELAEYQTLKGSEYRTDSVNGKPLFFTLNYVGETVPLIVTTNGNVVADTSNLRKANNLVQQYDFLKEQLAAQLLAQIGFNGGTRTNQTNPQEIKQDSDIDPFKS